MARRPVSGVIPDEAGNRLGGSGTQLRIYNDFALTVLSTLYANETSGTTLPNPLTPNAGTQTTITVAIGVADTTITVLNATGFAVGNTIPIYDGTNTVYKVITAIAGSVLTLDSAVGVAFLVANTLVGNPDMIGHVGFWLDDVRDYYGQTKDVASTRVLPPIGFPVRVPAVALDVQEEGAAAGSRATINFVSPLMTAADDAVNARVNVTARDAAVGDMKIWLTDTAPTDWLLCYGQAISRATYAALFAVIGTVFGVGDGSTTFNLPDARGRVMLGQDDMGGTAASRVTAANAIGVVGGSATHALTTAELASHSHSHNHGAHDHTESGGWGGGQTAGRVSFYSANNNPDTLTTDATTPATDATTAGSGTAHNIVQPYLTVNYVIRT